MTRRAQWELAVKTHRQAPAPLARGDFLERLGGACYPRIVDQQADPGGGDRIQPGRHRIRIRHVHRGAFHCGRQVGQRPFIDVAHEYGCALADQRPGNCQAEPAGAGGHHGS